MKQIKHMILLCLLCLTGMAAQAQTGPADNEIWYTAAAMLAEVTGTGTTAGLHHEVFKDADGNTLTKTKHTWDETTGKGVITFDGDIATIGKNAFYKADVTSVTLPECVTVIGDYAFGNSKLTSIKLAEGLESIGKYAFTEIGLTSVDIPKSVTTIERNAFKCNNLSTIKVHWPEGAASIDGDAFVTKVQSPEYWFPAGSWKQKGTLYLPNSTSYKHYLTFRQDPNTPTDYYATFYTELQTSKTTYCYDLTLTDIKAYTGVLEPKMTLMLMR